MIKNKPFRLLLVIHAGLLPLLVLIWALVNLPVAHAAIILVTTAEDEVNHDGDCSLREAILAANTNTAVDACSAGVGIDTIQFNLITPVTITLSYFEIDPDVSVKDSDLDVAREALIIEGPGADQLTISGNHAARVFDIATNIPITLSGMTVRDGYTVYDGGGVRGGGAVTLVDMVVVDNEAGDDGGAVNVLGRLTLVNTQILSNTAAGQGGGVNSFGALTHIDSSLLQGNRAGDIAGGLYADRALTIGNSAFISNTAQTYAGGVWAWQNATIVTSTFAGNTAVANDMGALYVRYNLVATDAIFHDNTAQARGGAALVGGDAHLQGGSFARNEAVSASGGAVQVGGSLWLTDTLFFDNRAATQGGAVALFGGTLNASNVLLARNTAVTGSALYLNQSGVAVVRHATIAGPAQPANDAIGLASGQLTVTNSIIGGYATALNVLAGTAVEASNLYFDTIPASGTVSSGGHSFSGNPAFVDPASDDYHLSPLSEALNTGSDDGLLLDNDGDARPGGSGFDIGFDETDDSSDVAISKQVSVDPAGGAPITYTIAFSNTGTALLPRLTLTDTIPAQMVPVGVITSGVGVATTQVDNVFTWQVHQLIPGALGTLTVYGTLVDPVARGTFTNTVTVATIATETTLANNSADIAVTVPNFAPVMANDVVTTTEETAVLLSPLVNDSDGDPLAIVDFGQPAWGTAVLSGTQHITYTPGFEFSGSDTITYTVSDGELTGTAEITIHVTPVNDAPIISEGASVAVVMSEDSHPTPFALVLHASDDDQDPLHWAIGDYPAHGAAVVTAGPAMSATVAFTPTQNFAGIDQFQVTVTDQLLSDTITVMLAIDPVNDQPVAVDDVALALRQHGSGTIKLFAAAPGAALNVLANDADVESGQMLTVTAVTTSTFGGLATLDPGGDLLAYAPDSAFTGVEHFVYTVSDGDLVDTAVVTMTVVNGIDGGMNGETVVVPAIGLGSAFTVTATIPAAVWPTPLALIVDSPASDPLPPAPAGFMPAGMAFSLMAYDGGQPIAAGLPFAQPLTLTVDYGRSAITDIGPAENSLALYRWDGAAWAEVGVQHVAQDAIQNQLMVTVDYPGLYALFHRKPIFLPVMMLNYSGLRPDLIVDSVGVVAGELRVVVRNVGDAAVVDAFWVDLYLNPSPAPTAVNQTWQMLAAQGAAWGVDIDALPLAPGATLTLTPGDSHFSTALSDLPSLIPAGAILYVQVDVYNEASNYGNVLENHEVTGDSYNNISQPYMVPQPMIWK